MRQFRGRHSNQNGSSLEKLCQKPGLARGYVRRHYRLATSVVTTLLAQMGCHSNAGNAGAGIAAAEAVAICWSNAREPHQPGLYTAISDVT